MRRSEDRRLRASSRSHRLKMLSTVSCSLWKQNQRRLIGGRPRLPETAAIPPMLTCAHETQAALALDEIRDRLKGKPNDASLVNDQRQRRVSDWAVCPTDPNASHGNIRAFASASMVAKLGTGAYGADAGPLTPASSPSTHARNRRGHRDLPQDEPDLLASRRWLWRAWMPKAN